MASLALFGESFSHPTHRRRRILGAQEGCDGLPDPLGRLLNFPVPEMGVAQRRAQTVPIIEASSTARTAPPYSARPCASRSGSGWTAGPFSGSPVAPACQPPLDGVFGFVMNASVATSDGSWRHAAICEHGRPVEDRCQLPVNASEARGGRSQGENQGLHQSGNTSFQHRRNVSCGPSKTCKKTRENVGVNRDNQIISIA